MSYMIPFDADLSPSERLLLAKQERDEHIAEGRELYALEQMADPAECFMALVEIDSPELAEALSAMAFGKDHDTRECGRKYFRERLSEFFGDQWQRRMERNAEVEPEDME